MVDVLLEGSAPGLARVAERWAAEIDARLRGAVQIAGTLIAEAAPRESRILDGLHLTFLQILTDLQGLVSGGGFLAKPGLFRDAPLFHMWWTLGGDGLVRARVDLDESSEAFYDYPGKEFFRGPAETGQLTVMGPYVDYLGTNEYLLTWGVPIFVCGAFVGTVGADVTLDDLQSKLTQPGSSLGDDEVLVNRKGRVIYSTTAQVESGGIIRSPDLAAWMGAGERMPSRTDEFEMWPCAEVPWAVLRLSRQVPARR